MGFHLFYQRLEVRVAHVGVFLAIEREMILREVFVLDEVLDLFKSRWAVIPFQLVLKNKKLVPEMIDRDDVAVHVVLHKRDVALRVWRCFQLDIFEMGYRIKCEKAEEAV